MNLCIQTSQLQKKQLEKYLSKFLDPLVLRPREGWQWWFGDNSGGPYGEDDLYEEEDNWLSWLNVDLKDLQNSR
ncbi:unnamed protein product [Calypogeia fissa]